MDVENLQPGRKLELYVSPSCPYCRRAREHYDALGYPYTVYDAQSDLVRQREMLAYSGGDPTVPAIVVDGAYVQSGWGDPPRG